MAENLGQGVSYVAESQDYNYDMVVFQEQKPPLDTELNLAQELARQAGQRRLDSFPSGWLTLREFYTNSSLENEFWTQNPTSSPIPEYALVNGTVIHVTNTSKNPGISSVDNANLIDLDDPPTSGNRVNGVFLEVWRALLDPDSSENKPSPEVIIDDLKAVHTQSENLAWSVGENGLIIHTENGGQSWNIQLIDSKRTLNGVYFATTSIGWVVGDNGVIARTSSEGQRWTLLSSGIVENLNDVFAVSSLIVYAVGDTGTILKSTNGISWNHLTSGVTANLKACYFYDNQIGWVVGANGTILKTTNGGTSWLQLTSGITSTLNSVVFYDLNIGFAVGDSGAILRTSDGGLTWVNQSGHIFDSGSYSSLSVNYNDVDMVPNLDEYVDGEEVSGQFFGSNKNCTVMNVPVTKGDGLGTTTNVPGDIKVTVNGTEVDVDVLDGSTGQIILHEVPAVCDTVKVYYYYKISTEIFRGKAWIAGDSGTVLRTDDIGAKWIQQEPNTSYDLNSIDFININKGWVSGDLSVIRYTDDGGDNWSEQISDVVSRQVQRVYKEGNVDTDIYLTDDSIHPDANIETTKRVQVQYRIRVVNNVDPQNFPESGLGNTGIVALGPNATGSFSFTNMGTVTGDYGLWRAKCQNTVDGYCYAIPMFFVGRRNSGDYNTDTNANGSHTNSSVRPDLLTGTNIVDSDILDVRRKVIVPDVNELLDRNFDLLMANQLKTRIVRDTQGGDRYGTEILNVDRIAGTEDDGGRQIVGANLADAVNGDIKSTVSVINGSQPQTATAVLPESITVTAPSGLFHSNPAYFTAIYNSPDSIYHERKIPGYFEGYGSTELKFYFDVTANTTPDDDPNLQDYVIKYSYITTSSSALTFIPSDPKLVWNKSGQTGNSPFFYQGVLDSETSGRRIEEWSSGIPGYTNYALAYPYENSTIEQYRASPVELHYFIQLSSTEIVTNNVINVPKNIAVTDGVSDSIEYECYTVSKLFNKTSGIQYRLSDQKIVTVGSENRIQLTSISGFEFTEDLVFEIVYMVTSKLNDIGIRNGASVSFSRSDKGIKNFLYSDVFIKESITAGSTITAIDISNGSDSLQMPGSFIGVSTTSTVNSLIQPICWINDGVTISQMPISVQNFGLNSIIINFLESTPAVEFTVAIQATILQTDLLYNDSVSGNGLLIGYNYTPYQSVSGLPTNITVEISTMPKNLYISNLGTGGSLFTREPYANPLVQIPIGDDAIADDDYFFNIDLIRFRNFSIDSGFVQVPVIIPGSFGNNITLSSVTLDNLSRSYYGTSSKEFKFISEDIKIGLARKIFIPILARVKTASDNKLLRGEYLLLIVSRNELNGIENYTGYEEEGNSVIAVYRLPYKPLLRF